MKSHRLFSPKISKVQTSFVVEIRLIHLCHKMPDVCARLMDVLVAVEVNFFFLEGADQPFRVSVLPRTPSPSYRNLKVSMMREGGDIST